jgi:hypothetical protein
MQKLIRHGVFETNSSSSHSISISHDVRKYQTLFPDEDGAYIFDGGEFGWGYDSYTDADTKANYVATMSKELGEGRGDECDDGSTPLRDLL